MHNLKRISGTYKGLIGEILFASVKPEFLLTRFHPKTKYLPKMNLTEEQRQFLSENWYSIDAIHNNKIIEVKTRNRYSIPIPHKPKSSERTVRLLKIAQSLEFSVYLVTVWLEEGWQFSIEAKPFSEQDVCIDVPKRYDGACLKMG